MAGYIGSKASVVSSGAERKKTFAISTTTTSLTGLSYTPTYVHVFHNGVRLVDGSDFTATNGTSITLSNSAVSGDEVVVISYSSFQVADHYNKTESDNRYINTAGDTLTGTLGGTAVNLSGDLAAVNTTLTGYLRGPATFTIDPAAHADDTGLVIIAGNLQVDGSTTTINSTTLTVDDLNLTLASGAADSAAANGAGITIDGASASLLYSHSGTKFVLNKPLDVTGNILVSGTVDGIDIAARDAILTSTTTTAGAALPKAGGTMTGTLAMGANAITSAGLTVNPSLITASGDGFLQVASASSDLWTAINTGNNGYTSMAGEISVINSLDNTVNSFAGIFFQAGETSSGSQISSARIGAVRTGAFTADLAFATRNSGGVIGEKVRISSDGKVGIGYNNPQNSIHVLGNSAIPNVGLTLQTNDTANAIANINLMSRLADNNNKTVELRAYRGNLAILGDAGYGNVGIGTSLPTVKLDVVGPAGVTSFTGSTALGMVTRGSTGANDYSGIDFRGNNQTSAIARIATLSTGGGTFLRFGTSNNYSAGITNTAMTIDTVGKVGIGADTPAAKLHVKTSGADGIVLDQDTGSTNNSSRLFFNSTSGNWAIFNNSGLLNFQSGATAGASSGNYTDFQLTTTGAICRRPFTVEANNLNISSGYGINFSASSNNAGMTSEVLDDYEEGTFTPTLSGHYGDRGTTFTQGTRTGYYTKVGRTVTLVIQFSSSGVGAANNTDIVCISGLPFASVASVETGASAHHTVAIQQGACWTFITSTSVAILGNNGSSGGWSWQTGAGWATSSAAVRLTITYVAS